MIEKPRRWKLPEKRTWKSTWFGVRSKGSGRRYLKISLQQAGRETKAQVAVPLLRDGDFDEKAVRHQRAAGGDIRISVAKVDLRTVV
jgi:hypothetical protein